MTTRAGRLIRGAVLALVLAAPAFSQGLTEGPTRQVDPTGALMPKTQVGSQVVDKKVDSVCPFCGVSCLSFAGS